LKPERWGSTLVQEKYQAEKACDKRHPYHIIIIIIIIIIGITTHKNRSKNTEITQPLVAENNKMQDI